MVSTWEMAVVIGLTVLFIALYALGSVWNKRIQRSFWRALSKELKRYSRRVSYKSFGSSGFKVAFRSSSAPFSKVEIDLVLLAREMPLYLLAAYATGRGDRVIVKANVPARPDFHLEAFGKGSSLRREVELKPGKFKHVEAGGLSKFMEVRSTSPRRATEFLSKGVFERLMAVRRCLERFSISKQEPHVLIVCRRDEAMVGPVLDLLETTAKALRELSGAPGAEAPTRGRRGRR